MKKYYVATAFLIAALGNTPAEAKKVELTPMELQAIQSREFKAPKDQVFSSVVSVFQDIGYQMSGADLASGFILAGSANKNKTGFFEAMAGMRSSGGTRATAYIESMPSGFTRARLNFMNTKNSSSGYGSTSSKDKPILDAKTYQVVFERIEQALFERGALTKTAPAPTMVPAPVGPTAVTAPASTSVATTPVTSK